MQSGSSAQSGAQSRSTPSLSQSSASADDGLKVAVGSVPTADFEPYSSDRAGEVTTAAAQNVTARWKPEPSADVSVAPSFMPWALVAVSVTVVSCIPQLQFPGWQWAVGAVASAVWVVFVVRQFRCPVEDLEAWFWPGFGVAVAGFVGLVASWWACCSWASGLGFRQSWPWSLGGPVEGWVAWPVVSVAPLCALAISTHVQRHWQRYAAMARNVADPGTSAHVNLHGVLAVASRERLSVGSVCIVQVGEPVPTDCIVMSGRSRIDEGFLPNRSRIRSVAQGAWISAGSVNVESPLTVQVTAEPTLGALKSLRESLRFWWQLPHRAHGDLWSSCVQQLLLWILAGGLAAGTWLFVRPQLSTVALVAVLSAAVPGAWWLISVLRSRGLQSRVLVRGGVLLRPDAVVRLAALKGAVVDGQTVGWAGPARVAGVAAAEGWRQDQVVEVAARVLGGDARPWCAAIVQSSGRDPVGVAPAGRGADVAPVAGASGVVGQWQVEVSSVAPGAGVGGGPAVAGGSSLFSVRADGHEVGVIEVQCNGGPDRAEVVSGFLSAKVRPHVVSDGLLAEMGAEVELHGEVKVSDWGELLTSLQLGRGPHGWVTSSDEPTLPAVASSSIFCGDLTSAPPRGADVHLADGPREAGEVVRLARSTVRSARLRGTVVTLSSVVLAAAGGAGLIPPALVMTAVTGIFVVVARSVSFERVADEPAQESGPSVDSDVAQRQKRGRRFGRGRRPVDLSRVADSSSDPSEY